MVTMVTRGLFASFAFSTAYALKYERVKYERVKYERVKVAKAKVMVDNFLNQIQKNLQRKLLVFIFLLKYTKYFLNKK
jgi:hypothetical protein